MWYGRSICPLWLTWFLHNIHQLNHKKLLATSKYYKLEFYSWELISYHKIPRHHKCSSKSYKYLLLQTLRRISFNKYLRDYHVPETVLGTRNKNKCTQKAPALPSDLTVQRDDYAGITGKCDMGNGRRRSPSVMIVPSICVCSHNFFLWSLESLRL